jgi:hypothetical protein
MLPLHHEGFTMTPVTPTGQPSRHRLMEDHFDEEFESVGTTINGKHHFLQLAAKHHLAAAAADDEGLTDGCFTMFFSGPSPSAQWRAIR